MKKTLVKLSPLALLPALPLAATVSCSSSDWNAGIPTPSPDVWMTDIRTPFQFNVDGDIRLATVEVDKIENLVIPDVLEHNNIESTIAHQYIGYKVKPITIGSNFFREEFKGYENRVKSIVLPNTIKYIWDGLSKTDITTITIPNSTTNIGYGAFQNCNKLSEVRFSKNSNLKYIYVHAFENTALEGHLDIPSSVMQISGTAFQGTKLTSVNILNPNCTYSYDSFPDGCQVTGGIKE